jgi:hypothetical protein
MAPEDAGGFDGTPMLRFLDSYVLDALGALDAVTTAQLQALAPRVAADAGVKDGPLNLHTYGNELLAD